MADKSTIVKRLSDWVDSWRVNNKIAEGNKNNVILTGEILDRFVGELQNEILKVVTDFGKNTIGENAKLVLYSGVDYEFVKNFCAASNGEYYMISQTLADALWEPMFQEAVMRAIGDVTIKAPTTARVLAGKSYENDIIRGERISQYATASEQYLALDDFLSSKVAEAGLAKGNVVYLVGDDLKPDSVGLLTEVPTVLNDANNAGVNLSDVVTVGKNLTQNADGTYSFEIVDCSEVSVYLDRSGKVTFVDFVETILGNPTEMTDYELDYSA